MGKTEEIKDLTEVFKETKGYVLLPSGKGFDVFEYELDTLKAMLFPRPKVFLKPREEIPKDHVFILDKAHGEDATGAAG
jgi:hypothetical protein